MGQMDVGDARALEAAKTQSLFRTVNERVEQLNEAFDPVVPTGEWVCECLDLACVETILMPLDEYERIRSHPNKFFVLRGHDDPAVERIVDAGDAYVVVEKLGAGADFAVEHDPRSRTAQNDARREVTTKLRAS